MPDVEYSTAGLQQGGEGDAVGTENYAVTRGATGIIDLSDKQLQLPPGA